MKETSVQKNKHESKKIEQLLPTMLIRALKVLYFLSANPFQPFSLTEIATEFQITKTTASKILQALHSEEFITIRKITPRLWRVQFNIENQKARGVKISTNLIATYGSGLIDYICQKWGRPKSIVLFGSVRLGEDAHGSDLDIAIEIDQEKELQIVELKMLPPEETAPLIEQRRRIEQFENAIGRTIRFLFFHRNKVDINLFNNIANGIILLGFLEVKP